MCALIYFNKLDSCPYSQLVNVETHWLDLIHTFCRDFCTLQGLGLEPLSTAVTVGSLALPTIGKMASIMKVQPGLEWTSHGELAMTIPLPEQYSYHTIFACPVSKEQATGVNPPMMMACGHVVGKESLLRLCKGNMNTRIKCPYCPSDSTASQALQVYF